MPRVRNPVNLFFGQGGQGVSADGRLWTQPISGCIDTRATATSGRYASVMGQGLIWSDRGARCSQETGVWGGMGRKSRLISSPRFFG